MDILNLNQGGEQWLDLQGRNEWWIVDLNIFIYQCVTDQSKRQLRAILCHLNYHCVAFKSARQFMKTFTGRYEEKTLQIMHLESL